jgi:Zn-dependent protease
MEIIAVVIVILSIIFHEVAHGWVANLLGDPTAKYAGRLTLNPIPHIDTVGSIIVPGLALLSGSPFLLGWAKPVPVNPYNLRYGKWGEALTAFAGPATNVLIAVLAALLVRFGVLGPELLYVVFVIVAANISLAILNMLPIPPLDGSKVVAALLPPGLYMQYRELEHMTYALGPFGLILVLIIIVNFLSAPMGALVGSLFSVLTGIQI